MREQKIINMVILTGTACLGNVAWSLYEKRCGLENGDKLTRFIGRTVCIASMYVGGALSLWSIEAHNYHKEHENN